MFFCTSSRRAAVGKTLVLLVLMPLTTGCASHFREWWHNGFKVGPNYQKPAAKVADEYEEVTEPQISDAPPDHKEWWRVFNDPYLDRLIAIASQHGNHDFNAYGFSNGAGRAGPNPPNRSLREAALRMLQARAGLSHAYGNLAPGNAGPLPSTVSSAGGGGAGSGAGGSPLGQQEAYFDYQRRQSSKESFPANVAPGTFVSKRSHSFWGLGLRANWELDVWGKLRRAIEAGQADFDSTIEDYDAILVAILGDVAHSYFEIRTLQQGLYYTQQNVEAQRGALELAETKFRAGATTELDVQQARTNLETTRSLVPEIKKRLQLEKNMLCFLIGVPAHSHNIDCLLGDAQPSDERSVIPTVPAQVAVGIPADLMRRRPDLRATERRLAAESARIGIRASDLFPSFSIFGTIQYETESIKDLFGGKAVAGTLGAPSVRWPILHYGRIRSVINQQDARFQEVAAEYERVVLQANREVADTLVCFIENQRKAAHLAASVEALKRSVEIALTQYRGGIVDFNRVFTLQSDLAARQNDLVIAQGDTIAELIATYRNLGGGWEIRLNPPPKMQYPEAIEPPAPENGQPPLPEPPAAPAPGAPQPPTPMPDNGEAPQPMPEPPADPNGGGSPATMMRILPQQPAHQDRHAWKISAPQTVAPAGHWESQTAVPRR